MHVCVCVRVCVCVCVFVCLRRYLNVIPTIALQNGVSSIMSYSKKYPDGAVPPPGEGLWTIDNGVLVSIIAPLAIVVAALLLLVIDQLWTAFGGTCGPRKGAQKVQSSTVHSAVTTGVDGSGSHRAAVIPVTTGGPSNPASLSSDDPLVVAEANRAQALLQQGTAATPRACLLYTSPSPRDRG